MKYIVDRVEEKFAVCEDEEGNMVDILLANFKFDVKEKDVVVFASGKYILLEKETNDRKKYIENLTKDMWEN